MLCINSGDIFSPLHQKTYNYNTYINANDNYLREVIELWGAESEQELSQLKRKYPIKADYINKIIEKNLHDYFWDWEDIICSPEGYTRETLYLTADCDGKSVQGILHAYFPEESKIAKGANIVYIDRLAVAPWNRQIHGNRKTFKGVGSRLIYAICQYSKQKGLGGCLGLHALPDAEPFYRNFKMIDLGIDDIHEGLRYFELDVNQAGAI